LLLLGQQLDLGELLGIGLVVTASAAAMGPGSG
jgi:threonine/homoserine efflux transporter RhtA